jgi:hypothetical protein
MKGEGRDKVREKGFREGFTQLLGQERSSG